MQMADGWIARIKATGGRDRRARQLVVALSAGQIKVAPLEGEIGPLRDFNVMVDLGLRLLGALFAVETFMKAHRLERVHNFFMGVLGRARALFGGGRSAGWRRKRGDGIGEHVEK